MIHDTTKLQDSKVVKEIQIALSGIGKLDVNHKIRYQTWELEKVFGFSKEELCSFVYTYIRDRDIIGFWVNMNRINNNYSSMKTFITWTTHYCLCNFLKHLRGKKNYIHLDYEYEPPDEEITGGYSRNIIDNYTDGITTENTVIKKELLQKLKNYMGESYYLALADMKSKKECDALVGYEYSYFCKKLKDKVVGLRRHLKSLGFEYKDFFITIKKTTIFSAGNTICIIDTNYTWTLVVAVPV